MIKKSNKFNEYKTVLNNIIALFFLRGLDYLLPLILIPYLVRTLGVENFGLLSFATATIAFFRGIVSYGFDLTGTQQISVNRENKKALNEIFSSILLIRVILAALCTIPMYIGIVLVDKISMHSEIFYLTFLVVIGDALFPEWFFRGIEKMKIITYSRVIYKSIFFLLIILFVENKNDYYLVPLIDGVGAILSGLFALILVCKTFKTSLVKPTYKMLHFQLQNSWHVFISKMSVHFYSSINIFVLGLLSNNLIVGYYSLAYKIYTALNGLFMPFNQALFPFLSKKYTESKKDYLILIRLFGKAYLIVLVLLALITFEFSDDIVKLIAGSYMPDVNEILKIFAVTLLFSIGSFCSPLLIIKSESKKVARITIYSMILNLVLLFPAIYWGGAVGLAFTYLLVQLFQAALQLIHNPEIYQRKILIKNI